VEIRILAITNPRSPSSSILDLTSRVSVDDPACYGGQQHSLLLDLTLTVDVALGGKYRTSQKR
jgi:hypothetical protein